MSDPALGFAGLGMIGIALLTGYPMAFSFLFVALIVGYLGIGNLVFYLLTFQFFGTMRDTTLAAIPLFLFMGYVLEQSGLMDRVFRALRLMLSGLSGSLYLITLLVAIIFGAATGIVGASVTILGVMAAPVMKESGYDTRLSAGAISAGGTLGILIPPSILLIVMGPVMGVPVTDLFAAAIVPGLMLGAIYILYTLIRCWINPKLGPPLIGAEAEVGPAAKAREFFAGVFPVAMIIVATLGVILAGIATPTDAAATGSFASLVLALSYRSLNFSQFKTAVFRTALTTSFIMFLLVSANFFGAVFSRLGSDKVLTEWLLNLPLTGTSMLVLMLAIVFVLGSPLEWIPIVLVVVPIFMPTVTHMGVDPLWFAILVAVTLQTSWLTPPMALSSYFLKGVVPSWRMGDIYAGQVQFIVLQLVVVGLLMAFPGIVGWLPSLIDN
ncbi:TRAP transporter large permease [Salinisphaera aquimarina]|uniref:TRAP transporter large permease subunit n=1 Tax=Salinisphaera aquimarina TaxID=2094031 RepID=A0ABV7EPP4_9GAMM